MSHSFDICIDESGDQGFNFGPGKSSEWFVVAATVGLSHRTPMWTDAVKRAKEHANWRPNKPLHFKDVKLEHREAVVNCLTSDQSLFRGVVVMVHKPSLDDPETFNESNRLFFYSTRYVLERASWLCRDSREGKLKQHGDGTARVVISSIDEVSHERISRYFSDLKSIETTIDWNHLDSSGFITRTPGQHAGLQIADCMASGFFCGDHPNERKRSPRWCELWKPTLYSRYGKYRGYGLKIFPATIEKRIAQGEVSPWAMSHYSM